MTAPSPGAEPTRPVIVVALADPERTAVVDAMT